MVSVIIPCYNVEEYLAECLDSVLGQTFSDLEVICVNDGSTDGTAEILEKYRANERVKIITQANSGASSARNAGLDIAKGDYVQFLDADDLLMKDKISHQMRWASAAPDLIAGAYKKIHRDGKEEVIHPMQENRWMGLMSGRLGCTCSNLWKSAALRKAGQWNEDARSSQEYDLMFRILKDNPKVQFDDSPYTIVRERKSGSISQINLVQNWERYVRLRGAIIAFLEEKGELSDQQSRSGFYQVLFDAIRILARFDLKRASHLYQELIPEDFRPGPSRNTGKAYPWLFSFLGFHNTERVISVYRTLGK